MPRFYVEPDVHRLMQRLQPSEAEKTETALTRLLVSIEDAGGPGPAGRPYREALKRHGQRLVAFAGAEGLQAAAERLCAAAGPQQAKERRDLLTEAWAGLPGAAA